MGGTSLVTKGILGPIEGDVLTSIIGMPIVADVTNTEARVETRRDIHKVTTTPDIQEVEAIAKPLETEVTIPALEVEATVKE